MADENVGACLKYRLNEDGAVCQHFVLRSNFSNFAECEDMVVPDGYLWKEFEYPLNRTCKFWKIPTTEMGSLLLPGLVFGALFLLMIIMIVQSIRERSAQHDQYLALQTTKDANAGADGGKVSRVPKEKFTCGGMQMTFTVSSNMHPDQKPVNKTSNKLPKEREGAEAKV